jgi:hypothetical protein
MKAPKAPKPTAQETAMVERQRRELDEVMEEEERRTKAIVRGTLGTKSLLAKPSTMGAGNRGRGRAGGGGLGAISRGPRGMNLPASPRGGYQNAIDTTIKAK